MKYIIIDWMSNVCFDTDNLNLTDFEEASEFLDQALLKASPNLEACENQECICEELGHQCSSLEQEREEYSIEEYDEELDRIMWNGQRYVFKPNYYKDNQS